MDTIISAISSEAEKKGVRYITCNGSDAGISNYDYIQKAAIEFHTAVGEKHIDLELPANPFHARVAQEAGQDFEDDPAPEYENPFEDLRGFYNPERAGVGRTPGARQARPQATSWLQGTGKGARILWAKSA